MFFCCWRQQQRRWRQRRRRNKRLNKLLKNMKILFVCAWKKKCRQAVVPNSDILHTHSIASNIVLCICTLHIYKSNSVRIDDLSRINAGHLNWFFSFSFVLSTFIIIIFIIFMLNFLFVCQLWQQQNNANKIVVIWILFTKKKKLMSLAKISMQGLFFSYFSSFSCSPPYFLHPFVIYKLIVSYDSVSIDQTGSHIHTRTSNQ